MASVASAASAALDVPRVPEVPGALDVSEFSGVLVLLGLSVVLGGAIAAVVRWLGLSGAEPASVYGSFLGDAGLDSFSRFFFTDLVENSTLNGADEDDVAAWLLKSAPH